MMRLFKTIHYAIKRYVVVKKYETFFFLLSYYNSSSVCLFVCLWVCSLSPPRSFDGSSPNFVGVCRWTSHLPLRGSFSKRSTGRRVNGSLLLSTILYRDQPHTTQLQRRLLHGKQQSLIRRLLVWCMSTTYVGGPGNCYWGVLFLKRQRGEGATGQWVKRVNGSTGHFHFHYIIYDSTRHQAHATPLQKAHGAWWHQAHTTLLQKAHSVFCSLDR